MISVDDKDGQLIDKIEKATKSLGLQVVNEQKERVIQLHETMKLRHGVILLGPTGAGKTSVYKVSDFQ